MANVCPSDSELSKWAANQLDPSEQERVDAHVAQCIECGDCLRLNAPPRPQPIDEPVDAQVEPPERDVEIGRVVGGRYRILELLGKGGMGRVYLADDSKMPRKVAIKRNGSALDRFAREATIAGEIASNYVVRAYDFGEDDDGPYLVLEYVRDGVNLGRRLRGVHEGRLLACTAVKIATEVARALQDVHKLSIIHRDVKPGNILLGSDGVKLTDFGIACKKDRTSSEPLTTTNAFLGTPPYMAPEQVWNPSSVDERADIYSLGVVLFEMVAGSLPAETPPHDWGALARERKVADGVSNVISRLTLPVRDDRPTTMTEVLNLLEAVTISVPLSAVLKLGRELAMKLSDIHAEGRVHGAVCCENIRLDGIGQARLVPPSESLGDDLLGLGKVLFELAVGVPPTSSDLRRLAKQCSDKLEEPVLNTLLRMCDPNPERRLDSAPRVVERLYALQRQYAAQSGPTSNQGPLPADCQTTLSTGESLLSGDNRQPENFF
jgi:serine/threonine protein kinase